MQPNTRKAYTIEDVQRSSEQLNGNREKDALCAVIWLILQLERLAGRESKYKSVGTVGFYKTIQMLLMLFPNR